MTTTALMPVDPAASPQHATRILPIRANLLPRDISDGRRARRTRTVVLIAVVLVLAMLGGWYWNATTTKRDAESEFEDATRQVAAVQRQQNQYTNLTTTKNSNTVMSGQLAKLMANDLSWQILLDLVRSTGAEAEAQTTEIGGEMSTTPTGGDEIGTLSISGNAPDKKAVAKYIELLAKLKADGIADPFVTSVSGTDSAEDESGTSTVSFELTVSITDKALCGKFSKIKCSSGGN
ncbi:hypothetical protein [Actinoplanes palleronii]|uniref:hypothetical protein n=1 Tax=Actinoplanes palleronii TaxID=113570 RepID=UPI0019428D0B|nr:hypothetical protein [Actinoplanes palleronii]